MSMKKASSWKNYEESLSRMKDYIYAHLDDDIDLYTLADVAALSAYHWHRVYHALYGETIAATVKRLRLQHAAADLAQTSLTIKEVARRSGYRDLQSFTRIFKSAYGMPPASYRNHGSHTQFQLKKTERVLASYDLSIRSIPNLHAISLEHVGPYLTIGKAFDKLYSQLAIQDLLRAERRSVAIFYDDPTIVPEKQLRSRANIIVEERFPIKAPLVHTEIAGGLYAVLRHKGPYANMKAAYQWLYGEWLVQSGREVANKPVFEEYLNSPRVTPPGELLTQIFLPLI